MAKMGYAVIYFLIAITMVFFLLRIGRNRQEKKDVLLRIQIFLFLCADFIYMTSFFSEDVLYLTIVHCFILLFETWIGFFFLRFAMEYTKVTKTGKIVISSIAGGICFIDSNLIAFNIFTRKLYQFVGSSWNHSMFLKVDVNPWYMAHLIILADLFVASICFFFYRAIFVPRIFKDKYIFLGVALIAGLFVGGLFRYISGFTMFPAIIFLTYAECIYFVLYYYIPKRRALFMNNFVIDKTATPILLFDNEDELQVLNESALTLLDAKPYMNLMEFISDNDLRYILNDERRKAGKTKEFTLTTKIKDLSFLIHGQELYDEKNRFIGTLLLYNDITSQEKLKDEATFHATRDNLTGMWNRDFFFENVEKEIIDNPDIQFVMIASDIHRFMMFNEILGKRTGDDLLVSIANGFAERCREHWVIGRIAGDRFAMIMPRQDFDEERFMSFTQRVFERRGYSLKVHLYVGVYEITDRSLTPQEMYDRTYMAIESIKGNMQCSVAYYDDGIRQQRLREAMTIDDMEKAIRNHEFVVFLQPQVDSKTHRVVGCEALVRWMSEEKGMVAPVEFIPLFESNGMISRLDYYVWEEVCKILKGWKDEGNFDRTVSVNISAKDFYLTDLYSNVVGLVEKYDINPRNLKLEITESAFALNAEEQANLVRKFREYGFIVEIDDFGSGYSSLNSLKDIEVDVLKLDMKFFERCYDPIRAQKVVESVISLAYNLNMLVIAEGVETEEQVLRLQGLGCDIIQGFYYARPMPVDEFEKYIEEYPCEDFSEIYARMKEK